MIDYQGRLARIRARSTARGEGRAGFHIRALAGDDQTTEILVYDEIGFWGVTAGDFVRALQQITTPKILVRLNSPGGDVFDGLAIYNALRAHPAAVQTHVDGLAASVASIIMLAGDSVTAAEDSFVMVHSPWSIVIGDAAEMRAMADILDKIGGQIAAIYLNATGESPETVAAWLAGETWFTGAEAMAAGLVGELRDQPLTATAAPEAPAARAFDLSGIAAIFENMPEPLQQRLGRARRPEAGQEGAEMPQDGPGMAQEGAGDGQDDAGARVAAAVLARRRRLQGARLAGVGG